MITEGPFEGLTKGGFGAIYADPAWAYKVWSAKGTGRSAEQHYGVIETEAIAALPVSELAAPDCALFIWVTWPLLPDALEVIAKWGFTYKTCAFAWMKADATQIELFHEEVKPFVGMGHWTRANSEVCLLATKGRPKRLNADVRQGIIEPRRQHSRKPDCVYGRIEALVGGPYLELFARTARPGWSQWGNQTEKFLAPVT